MMEKYIVFADGHVRVFPTTRIHSFMAGGDTVLSAGFCDRTGNKIEVWGESTTLGKKSRPEDAEIIQKHFANL